MENKKPSPQDKLFMPLVEDINNYCIAGYSDVQFTYNDITMACVITTFCLKNDISVDTYNWDTMISYLWEHLDKKKLSLEFTDEDDFDLSCGRYLC